MATAGRGRVTEPRPHALYCEITEGPLGGARPNATAQNASVRGLAHRREDTISAHKGSVKISGSKPLQVHGGGH